MQEEKLIPELFEKPTVDFQEHLEIEENERIIFSGKYGIGKSTFLKHFFEKEAQYNVIHLYPVNYSVATNEDIFSLIKFDILFNLLDTFENDNNEVGHSIVLPEFIKTKLSSSLGGLIKLGAKVGKLASNEDHEKILSLLELISEPLVNIEKSYKKFYDKINSDLESKDVNDFLQNTLLKEGSIYEGNYLTEIIRNKLHELKEKGQKKNVLIIDDLDRIDPHHVFRLFNVFAAHLDYQDTTSNKFGFDQIIFVCDIENIKEIFHHRYGINVDFYGYINKFFSNRIFQYENKQALKTAIDKMLKGANFKCKEEHTTTYLAQHGTGIKEHLSKILYRLVDEHKVNLRELQIIFSEEIPLDERTSINFHHGFRNLFIAQSSMLLVMYILHHILGSTDKLKKVFQSSENAAPSEVFRKNYHEYDEALFLYALFNVEDIKQSPSILTFDEILALNSYPISCKLNISLSSGHATISDNGFYYTNNISTESSSDIVPNLFYLYSKIVTDLIKRDFFK